MNVFEVYQDCLDVTNKDEGGYFSVDAFNRYSWLGQLKYMGWLSGSPTDPQPPSVFNNQKDRDFLSDFLNKYPKQVSSGFIDKPTDYYLYDNGYKLNGKLAACDDSVKTVDDAVITILSGDKFKPRINTYIKRLKPTFKNPICKVIGNQFEFYPKDLGSVVIEYFRYPVKAKLVMKDDPVFNDQVYDIVNSVDFEWGEFARPLLVWFICQEFFKHTRDTAGFQLNQATEKEAKA